MFYFWRVKFQITGDVTVHVYFPAYNMLACVTTQPQVPLPLIFLSYYTFTVLPTLSSSSDTACSNSNASMAFTLFHTLAPTSETISPKTPGTLLLSLPSKANSRHFSSQNTPPKQRCPSPLSVCTVCVCAHTHTHTHSHTLTCTHTPWQNDMWT